MIGRKCRDNASRANPKGVCHEHVVDALDRLIRRIGIAGIAGVVPRVAEAVEQGLQLGRVGRSFMSPQTIVAIALAYEIVQYFLNLGDAHGGIGAIVEVGVEHSHGGDMHIECHVGQSPHSLRHRVASNRGRRLVITALSSIA